MPNWCDTDLIIEGPISDVDEILDAYVNVEEGTLDFDKVIPYPRKYKALDAAAEQYMKDHPNDWTNRPADGFNQGGYDWCVENWGTKWNAHSGRGVTYMRTTKNKRKIKLMFETAWSPASPVFARLAQMYPDVQITARSYERGMGYKYVEKYENGVETHSEETDYRGGRGG